MTRDDVAIRNERVKLLAGFFNAIGLALIGVGALAPLVAFLAQPLPGPARPTAHPQTWLLFAALGLACHGFAHYVLRHLVRAPSHDTR